MTALITGGGGFIGSHLVESRLAAGRRVRAMDLHLGRLAHLTGNPRLELVQGDIADASLVTEALVGVEVVYHLASAHLAVNLAEADYRRINVNAAVNLLAAARAAGVRRLVHVSSVGVIGDVRRPPADETAACHPTNVYERTKLAGEQAALQFAAQTGFPVVVVRPAWVYGPRCPRTEKLFRAIGRRRFVMFGNGRTLRHPIYVSDVVRGMELCAETERGAGQVYILAGERSVTIQDLVRLIAEVLCVPPPALRLPAASGIAVGYAMQAAYRAVGRQPPFSRRSVDFFLKDNAYDIGKAKSDLGFQPQVGLRAGLSKTHQWLRERRDG